MIHSNYISTFIMFNFRLRNSKEKERNMKHDFPQVDLPCEILAWNDVTEDILNIYKQSCRLKAGIFAICTEGNMTATINLIDYEIKPNDLITLLPGTIIQFRKHTKKVRLCFTGFSSGCVERINLIKSMLSSFSKIAECPVVELQEDVAGYMIDYFSLLARATCNEKFSFPSEMIEVSLNSILTAIGLVYRKYSSKSRNISRKEEICRELLRLVTEHYTEDRRAQFYADKLGISLQHLSTTVKQVTGRNVLDVIAYVVIIDAKAKLKSSNMTIQEIAYSLNFPSASFFGKYFRRYVGMSPLEFRNS